MFHQLECQKKGFDVAEYNIKLHNALVRYYQFIITRSTIDVITVDVIRDYQAVKNDVWYQMIRNPDAGKFENIHHMLSVIAIMIILHNSWIVEQGFDEKYTVDNTFEWRGFDNKYPPSILEVFEKSWLEVFPDAVIKECVTRDDFDFKDVEYYHSGK